MGGIAGVILLGCAGFFVAAVVTGVNRAHQRTAQDFEAAGTWATHASPEDGYAVDMPGRVRKKTSMAAWGNGLKRMNSVYAGTQDRHMVTVDVYHDVGQRPSSTWEEKLADITISENPALSKKNVLFAGQDCVQLEGQTTFQEEVKYIRRRLFTVGNHFYDVEILCPDQLPSEENSRRFFDSFRLLNGN